MKVFNLISSHEHWAIAATRQIFCNVVLGSAIISNYSYEILLIIISSLLKLALISQMDALICHLFGAICQMAN